MANTSYTVEVADKVSPAVAARLEQIAIAARSSYDAVEKLKTALASIDGKALTALSIASARAQRVMDQSALAAQKLATETQRTSAASAVAASAQQKLASAASQAQTASARLATAQQQTATATSNAAAAAARAATAQSNQAAAALRLQNAQKRVNDSMTNYIRNAVRLAGAGLGARAILASADAYTVLQNKLQVVSESQKQVNDLTQKLFELANRTRAPVEETATAFTRFDRALANLGASQEESLRLTETVNKSLIVSGSTSGEAAAGLLQLSQAFNKGKLDGDEFRTVMELMPSVADAIAKELGVTRGELLKLAPQGKITADVMRRAFANAADEIDAKFGKTIPTLSQSLTVFRNNFIQALGELNKAIGFTAGLSKAIVFISEHLREVGVISATVGAGMLVAFGPAILGALLSVAKAANVLRLALAANPIILLVAAIAGLVTWLVLFRDKSELARAAVDNLGFALDGIVGTIRGIGIFIGRFVGQSVDVTVNAIKAAYNAVVGFVEDTINFGIKGINKLREFAGQQKIELVHFDRLKTEATEWTDVGKLWADSLNEGFDQQGGAIQKFFNGEAKDKLEEFTVSVRKIQTPTSTADPGAEKRAVSLAKVNLQLDNEIERLQMLQPVREAQARFDQIEETLLGKKIILNEAEAQSIRNKIDTIIRETQVQSERDRIYEMSVGVTRDYNNTLAAADDLLKRNKISQELYNRVLFQATEAKLNQLDPLRQVNIEIDEENRLLSLIGPKREIEQRLQQIVNDKKSQGIKLTEYEIEVLRTRLTLQNELIRTQQAEAEVYDATVDSAKRYIEKLDAINKLKQAGTITKGQAATEVTAANPQFDFQNTQTEFDANVQRFDDMYLKIQELRDKDLINERTAAGLRAQVWAQQQDANLKTASTFFGNLSQLQKSENSKIARIGKAAAIAGAVIDTYKAANAAYAAMAPVPFIGPALGAAAAAAAIVAGLANVRAIQSQSTGFMQGGWTGGGAIDQVAGSVHGQEYVMDHQSTARIGVSNLDALRSGAAQVSQNSKTIGTAGGQSEVKVNIENYGTSKNFEVQQLSAAEIRIIARDEANKQITRSVPELVSGEIANPNSKISKSISKNTQAPRRR